MCFDLQMGFPYSYAHQHGLAMYSERQKKATPHQQEYLVAIPGWVVALGINLIPVLP